MQQTFMRTKLLMTCLLFAVLAVSTACDREDDLSLTGTSWKLYGYVDTSDNNWETTVFRETAFGYFL